MDKSKILTIITAILGIIGVFFLIRVIMAGDEAIETSPELQSSIVDPFARFAEFLLIATAVIAIVVSLFNLIKHPQALKKSLLGVAVLAVILIIAYFTADDSAVTNSFGEIIKDGEAGSVSKWVSALITYTLILGAVGIGLIGWGFVKSVK